MKTGAYIVQANKNEPIFLCVMDYERGEFHQFEIPIEVAARLASECSERVNVHLGATDFKLAHEEIARVMTGLTSAWGQVK